MLRQFIIFLIVLLGFVIEGFSNANDQFTRELCSIKDSSENSISHLYEQTNQAREYLHNGNTLQCLTLCRRLIESYYNYPNADVYLGYLFSYKAGCYKRLGDLELSRANHLLVDWFATLKKNESLRLSNQINLSTLEIDHKNFETARNISENLLKFNDFDSQSGQQNVILNNIALCCVEQGDYQRAEEYYSILFERIKNDTIRGEFDEPLMYRNYAYFLQLKGNLPEALVFMKKSLSLYNRSYPKGHFQIGYTHKYLADLFADLDSTDMALKYYSQSIKILQGDTMRVEGDSREIRPIAYETVYLFTVASYVSFVNSLVVNHPEACDIGIIENTLNLVISAEKRINRIIRRQSPSTSVFILAEKVRVLFDAGIECALQLYELTGDNGLLNQAFDWSVRAKAYSIRVQSEKEQLAIHNSQIASLFEKQKSLLNRIHQFTDMGNIQLSPFKVDTLVNWLAEYEFNNDSLNIWINKRTPSVNFRDNPYGDLRAQSKSWKQSLISYHILNESIVVFLLDRGNIKVKRIEISQELKESVREFKSLVASNRAKVYDCEDVDIYESVSYELYKKLLGPALDDARSHLIIIQPDGMLLGLPFDLLVSEKHAKHRKLNSFRDLDYVLNDYVISYWMGTDPDLTVKKASPGKTLLMSCFPKNDSFMMAKEIQEIQRNFASKDIEVLWTGGVVPISKLSGYRVIHFASHYQMNEQDPLESGLVCTNNSNKPYINLKDILAGTFTNTRIFINGCHTGDGKVNSGQGLMSLGLVFGISGADEVITHLWQAEDKVSETISVDFYARGVPKDFSYRLNKVKKKYLESAPSGLDHPHFWGGIICSSKPSSRQVSFWWGLIPISLGIIIVLMRKRN